MLNISYDTVPLNIFDFPSFAVLYTVQCTVYIHLTIFLVNAFLIIIFLIEYLLVVVQSKHSVVVAMKMGFTLIFCKFLHAVYLKWLSSLTGLK